MDTRIIQVMVIMPPATGFFADVKLGLAEFARRKGNWKFLFIRNVKEALPMLSRYQPDGIIVEFNNPQWMMSLLEYNRPCVSISDTFHQPVPCVAIDDMAVGRLAADYFLGKGFENFGFIGEKGKAYPVLYSELRSQGFFELIQETGYTGDEFLVPPGSRVLLPDTEQSLVNWIKGLPCPVGVLAANDGLGQQLMQVCESAGMNIPDQVAVLGVDNDPVECEFCRPTLSSIDTAAHRVGREACLLLEQLLMGVNPINRTRLIPPAAVVTRQSTDMLAVGDSDVASAVRFIRDHVDQPINTTALSRSPGALQS